MCGDTAKLQRDPNLKGVIWNNDQYDSSITRKVVQKGSHGFSLKSKELYKNCYLTSEAVFLERNYCGFKMIRGYIYEDKNRDYKFTSADQLFANVKVQINGNNYTYTDENGLYTFRSDKFLPGKNTVTVVEPGFITASGSSYFYSGDTSYMEINITAKMLLASDLVLDTRTTRHRPGFTVPFFFNITNHGNLTNGGILTVKLNDAFTFSSSTKTPTTINGGVLTFVVDNMLSNENQTITVYATLFSRTPLGSETFTEASLITTFTDVNLNNNNNSIGVVVTGSYDPNEIEVNPIGNGLEGCIMDTTKLDYTIRFQNLGSDTAFTVVVKDKLPNGVNFSEFLMKNSSHKYELSLIGDTIVWTFKNIKLPHKGIDEPKSHGLINYKINQKAKNPAGTEIKNKAAIYFDFNAPVLTNEVLNTVDNGIITGIDEEYSNDLVWLFPNPSDGHFSFQSLESGMLKIFDNLGQPVYSEQYKGKLSVDLSHLPKGIYHYKTEGASKLAKGKIILK